LSTMYDRDRQTSRKTIKR